MEGQYRHNVSQIASTLLTLVELWNSELGLIMVKVRTYYGHSDRVKPRRDGDASAQLGCKSRTDLPNMPGFGSEFG